MLLLAVLLLLLPVARISIRALMQVQDPVREGSGNGRGD